MIISLDRSTGGGGLNWWGGINRKDPIVILLDNCPRFLTVAQDILKS